MTNSNTTIATKVTFQENCEYESSVVVKDLPIPRQNVQITLSLENLTANLPTNYANRHQSIYMANGQPKNYFTDTLRCTATVTLPKNNLNEIGVPIQAGRIEFYYQPEDSSVQRLLNKPTSESKTCLLNQNGQAAIDIQPKQSGTIIATYVDDNDNYIQENSATEFIELYRMPVTISFTDTPPYIANVEDSVDLEVSVKDINNQNLNYGLVTFLHYTIKQEDINNPTKRVEKVIGNPVLVQNGKAKITYIPVQTDNYDFTDGNESYDLEPESLDVYGDDRYVENIRAVYNYDSDNYYGIQWKYYVQKSTWTSIAIAKRNSLTIGIDNADLDINMAYHINESNTCSTVIKGYLHDKNNDIINLTNNDDIDITYHIQGTHSHPLSKPEYNTVQSFEYIEYELDKNDISLTTNNGQTSYDITLPRLLPGTYTIFATTNLQHTIDSSGPDSDSVSNDIYYDAIDNSNELLITVDYDGIDYTLNTTPVSPIVNNNFTITGTIQTSNQSINNLLNNQKCYFYVPALQKQYTGTITLSNNTLTFASNNIKINTSGQYSVSIIIPNGIYSTNYNASQYHEHNVDFHIPAITNTIDIVVNEHINISLEATFSNSNYAPCEVGYSIIGENITKEVAVSLSYKLTSSNDEPTIINDNIILTKNNNTNSGNIPTLLYGGDYQLIAKTDTQTFTTNFTVTPGPLQQRIITNNIEMGLYKTIGIYLTNNSNIRDIDISKISIYTQKANNAYNKNTAHKVNIQSYRFIDNQTLYLNAYSYTYDVGEYWVSISYAGDNNFMAIDCQPEKFTTYLHTPQVQLTKYNNTYEVNIFYYDNNGNKHISDNVLALPVRFINNNQIIQDDCLLIVDTNGIGGIFNYNEDVTIQSWWSTWTELQIDFNPYDETLISIIQNNNFDFDNLNNNFNWVFDQWELSGQQPNHNIHDQLENNDNKYLYDTYKTYQLTVQRPSD